MMDVPKQFVVSLQLKQLKMSVIWKEGDSVETYESKRISELVQKMNESKDVHELNKLYNEAEKELWLVYGTLFERLMKISTIWKG